MPNDHLVTPLAFSLPLAIDGRNQDHTQILAQPLPCKVTKVMGEFVEVSFSVKSPFTIPNRVISQNYSQWIREPTQVGDEGYAVPSNYYLGGQTGDAGGNANLYNQGNLTPLIFNPVSQKKFPANTNRNLNAVFINAPQGVVMQDTAGDCTFTLTSTGIVIKIGGMTCTISAAGIDVEGGDIVNNHLTVGSTHVHGGVVTGGSNTTGPNP